MAINVGSIEGTITLKDQYTATAREITAETLRIKTASTELASSIGVPYKVAEQAIKRSESVRAKLLADYKRLAAGLDPVERKTQQYDRAVDTLTASLKAGIITQEQYNLRLAQTRARLDDNIHWTKRLGDEIGGSLKSQLLSIVNPTTLAIAGITALGAGTVKLVKDVVVASTEAETSARKVESAVARYGTRAGVTAADIDRLASSQSRLTGIDDELIAESTALALRFNRLSGDEIPRLVKVAQDMAEVTGMDLPAAMQKAGGYVNLPLQALTKLRREGYAVSDSQEAMIKKMLAAGDVAEAQAEIFKILEEQYGGAAVEARDTLGGALTALGTTWENFLEKVGEDRLGPLRRGVEQLIDLLEFLTGSVDKVALGFVNLQLSAARSNLTLAEGRQRLANMFGTAGETEDVKNLKKEIQGLEQAQAKLTLRLILPPGAADYLEDFASGHRNAANAADEQTDSEDDLNNKLRQQAEAIAKVVAQQTEQRRFLQQKLDVLGNLSPNDAQTRWEAEQRINEEHEYRLDLMAKEEQFGKRAGKALADSARDLKKLDRDIDLKLKLKFINPVPEITDVFDRLRGTLDQEMNNLLDYLGDLSRENAEWTLAGQSTDPITREWEQQAAEIKRINEEFWQDYSAEVRGGWMTASDVIRLEMEKVKAAVESGAQGALTAAEAEKELARLRIELLNAELDQIADVAGGWTSLFSTLSGLFGGFGSTAINVINQMIATMQSVQSAGSSIGGQLGGIVSSAGPFLAIAGAIVNLQRESAARDRARQYTSSASVGFETDGAFEAAGRRGRELANALESTLTPIMDLIDRTLAVLPEIAIHAREDGRGFAALINDEFLGYFATLEDAIDAAVIAALQEIGPSLSETMRTVLANTTATTSEELQRDLETGLKFENLGIDDAAIRVKEMFAQFRHMMQDAADLGLDASKVRDQFSDDLQALKNELLGIDTSASDALARLIDVNRALIDQTNQMRQQSQQRLDTLREELAGMAGGPRTFVNEAGRGFTESNEAWERARQSIEREIDLTLAEIEKLPQGLSEMEIKMSVFDTLFNIINSNDKLSAKYSEEAAKYARIKVEAEIKALEMQLRVLGLWDEFAGMFADVAGFLRETAGETGKPRRGSGGGGGGGNDRDSAREFLRDRRIELAMRQLDEYARSVAEVSRQYDIEIAQAGKDKKLRAELIALRDRELALMADEQRRAVSGKFEEFLGLVSSFDQVRKTASDLIEEIEDSPYGDARKARMIGRVMGEVEKQLERMSRQEALDLFGGMIGDLERYGATEEMQLDIRKSMALLEHTLNLENYRVRIAALEAEGKLAPEVLSKIRAAFNYLESIDPAEWVTGGGGAGGVGDGPYNGPVFQGYDDPATTINEVADAIANATDLLRRYQDEGMDPYQLRLRDLNAEFAQIRLALGDTPEVMGEWSEAIERLRDEFNEPFQDLANDLTTGEMSGTSLEDRFAAQMASWEQLTAAVASGDRGLADEAADAARELLDLRESLSGTTTGGYAILRSQILQRLAELGINTTGAGAVASASGLTAVSGSSLFAGLPGSLPLQVPTLPTPVLSGLESLSPALDRQVSATEGVGSAIEVHGSRQERMMGDLVRGVQDLVSLMRRNGNGGEGSAGDDRPVSWLGGTQGIVIGDQPSFPQLTRRR